MKKTILSVAVLLGAATIVIGQNVGIGNTLPLMKLHVSKSDSAIMLLENTQPLALNASAAMYFKIGNGIAPYTGAIKTIVTGNNATRMGLFTYTANNPNDIKERVSIMDGGDVGIGTTEPLAKLDVAGDAYIRNELYAGGNITGVGSLSINGNISASGNITTNGKGVVYNSESATPLKIYRRTTAFSVVSLAAHSLSPEGTVGLNGSFTVPPSVLVGDIVSNTGAGTLHALQLVVYDVTINSFKVRILNTSNNALTQDCTWNIMCVGN